MKIRFFTDKTVKNDFLLIKIGDYIRLRKKNPAKLEKYKEIYVDPGVYELTKSDKYKWEDNINIKEFLDSLPSNHYFSADYPADMNKQYTDLFLKKSWDNALKYCNHPNYIVTVQFPFMNYFGFVEWFNKYNALNIESGIMGIGNLCRLFKTKHELELLKTIIDYIIMNCNCPKVHIYGLCLKGIKYLKSKRSNIDFSVDSTKWTRACTQELKKKYGICCNGNNRQEFFDEYKIMVDKKP